MRGPWKAALLIASLFPYFKLYQKKRKLATMSIFTILLELILSKIFELGKVRTHKIKNAKSVFLFCSTLMNEAKGFNMGEARQKLFLQERNLNKFFLSNF